MNNIIKFSKDYLLPAACKYITCIVLLFIGLGVLYSCNSANDTAITDLKVGTDSDPKGFAGITMPLTAKVKGNKDIKEIELAISPKSGSGWNFSQRYRDGLAGQKSADFKEAIPIPMDANVGAYQLKMKVIYSDLAEVESAVDFDISVDSSIPLASELEVGINADGTDLHLESQLSAAKTIKSVTISIIGDSWSREYPFDKASMVGKLEYNFHEHIKVAEVPEGRYEVVLQVKDQQDRMFETRGRFEKK
ncbi:hypothetical protein [Sphingobacterium pedocola]|uniref:DUF4625 domain-containing protein n=1 Tax=Sphingobacterium pedocola TaxID=2082722 RepID=A0ABR9T8D9_9SPHI|nr:hypothetical protein [Sphingobacterium pedocola]MBE8720892.1 hypothetical protein [Sphingobacterium pedocola]